MLPLAVTLVEVASQLRGEGYEVTISPTGADEGYDIVASKGDKKLAVEVKVNSQLRDSAASIKTLRRRAIEHGYDEFRLVVVNPPREVKISIEKLEEELVDLPGLVVPLVEKEELAPVAREADLGKS